MEAEDYILITQLNDFLFCPKSLYFGSIYKKNWNDDNFEQKAQLAGKQAHKSIDEGKYSSKKSILQNQTVVSTKLGLIGKIDIFDIEKSQLTERKNNITGIYEGHKFQLYAQTFCLQEAGYNVDNLRLYDSTKNIVYPIEKPDDMEDILAELVLKIRNFTSNDLLEHSCSHCQQNIYRELNFDFKET